MIIMENKMETGFLYNGEEVEVITHLETGEWMVREMYEIELKALRNGLKNIKEELGK